MPVCGLTCFQFNQQVGARFNPAALAQERPIIRRRHRPRRVKPA
jgi:hypothetical protein